MTVDPALAFTGSTSSDSFAGGFDATLVHGTSHKTSGNTQLVFTAVKIAVIVLFINWHAPDLEIQFGRVFAQGLLHVVTEVAALADIQG